MSAIAVTLVSIGTVVKQGNWSPFVFELVDPVLCLFTYTFSEESKVCGFELIR